MDRSAFLPAWADAATTSLGFFWMAFWAFAFGYLVSSAIQVFVTQDRMQRSMGETGVRSVLLGSFFGFVSSSCSFAALSTSRTLFAKGAGLVPALAFLLASTNLVIELGIVIGTFLTWQFVVGEYLGGLLLIALTWGLVRLVVGQGLLDEARERARESAGVSGGNEDDTPPPVLERLREPDAWRQVARRYLMEWDMVWKDVLIGFTVAGIIATFVSDAFFTTLFVGSGDPDPAFWQVLLQALVGPVAAFFTFIGSMGNIPLAAVLFSSGVSFAGVMAFLFSDLVVLPVLRIQASYYGWRMALTVLGVFLVALVTASVAMHYGFHGLGMLPSPEAARDIVERDFFKLDYTFALNSLFALVTTGTVLWSRQSDDAGAHDHGGTGAGEWALRTFAGLSALWLVGGLGLATFGP